MDALIRHLPQHSALLVFLAVLLEQAGLPLPSFAVLVAAGALALSGDASLPLLLVVSTVAALCANLGWYFAGRRLGQRVLRLLCRISLSPDTCVRGTQHIFERWGIAALLVAKFLPGISLVASPVAGVVSMPLPRFLAASVAGTLLWSTAYLGLGYLLHGQIDLAFAYTRAHLHQALAMAAGLFCVYLAWRGMQRWRAWGAAVPRIDIAELRKLLGSTPPPVLLDLRSIQWRGGQGAIPGARSVELQALRRIAAGFPHDREIVTYCGCPNDVSALHAARELRRLGFMRVRALRGGVDAWVAAGGVLEPSG